MFSFGSNTQHQIQKLLKRKKMWKRKLFFSCYSKRVYVHIPNYKRCLTLDTTYTYNNQTNLQQKHIHESQRFLEGYTKLYKTLQIEIEFKMFSFAYIYQQPLRFLEHTTHPPISYFVGIRVFYYFFLLTLNLVRIWKSLILISCLYV